MEKVPDSVFPNFMERWILEALKTHLAIHIRVGTSMSVSWYKRIRELRGEWRELSYQRLFKIPRSVDSTSVEKQCRSIWRPLFKTGRWSKDYWLRPVLNELASTNKDMPFNHANIQENSKILRNDSPSPRLGKIDRSLIAQMARFVIWISNRICTDTFFQGSMTAS
jgi:hypothetical protein